MTEPNWPSLDLVSGLWWGFWYLSAVAGRPICPYCGQPEHGSAACPVTHVGVELSEAYCQMAMDRLRQDALL